MPQKNLSSPILFEHSGTYVASLLCELYLHYTETRWQKKKKVVNKNLYIFEPNNDHLLALKDRDSQESNQACAHSLRLHLSPSFCTSKLQSFPESHQRCSLHGNTQRAPFSIKIIASFSAHPFALKIN